MQDGVTLTVAGPDGTYDSARSWVVAADGGRSTVREQMGLTLKGAAYESRYLIADIEVEGASPAGGTECLVQFAR